MPVARLGMVRSAGRGSTVLLMVNAKGLDSLLATDPEAMKYPSSSA